jgi:ABC-type polysaccharide/polyol phosphate transport system ATPase subunit
MTVIEFNNVSKRFTLHKEHHLTLQERITGLLRRRTQGEDYWALRDISFRVEQGQSLGLVGHNGAGKSTILKLMTRILEPTSGTVQTRGRIAALLELGSGFHPDLSGRENVYLFGSLMGLNRREMTERLPEIVAFADIGDFLDTEVKHYSSGMYTRLAFAAATAVDPDILITDEVLAVGDEAFQRKCMERIYGFRREGKTIVFVSHALDTVRTLCDVAVWIDHGIMRASGPSGEVIDAYLADVNRQEEAARAAANPQSRSNPDEAEWRRGSREVEITALEFLDAQEEIREVFYTGEPLTVRIHYHAHTPVDNPQFGLAFYFGTSVHIAGPNNDGADYRIDRIDGSGYVDFALAELLLLPGNYFVTVAIHDSTGLHTYDMHFQHYRFRVYTRGAQRSFGVIDMPARWSHAVQVADPQP